jgi:hypothetical protein
MSSKNEPDTASVLRKCLRVSFVIVAFIGSYFLIEQVLLFLGVDHTSANVVAAMVGLIIVAYALYPT